MSPSRRSGGYGLNMPIGMPDLQALNDLDKNTKVDRHLAAFQHIHNTLTYRIRIAMSRRSGSALVQLEIVFGPAVFR